MVYQTNVYILTETNSSHLKWMVGIFLLGWLIFRGYVSFRESKYNMRILLSRKHVWINNWRHKCPLWWGLNPCITWIRRLFCQKEVDWFQVCIYRGILWYDFPFVQRFGDMIFFRMVQDFFHQQHANDHFGAAPKHVGLMQNLHWFRVTQRDVDYFGCEIHHHIHGHIQFSCKLKHYCYSHEFLLCPRVATFQKIRIPNWIEKVQETKNVHSCWGHWKGLPSAVIFEDLIDSSMINYPIIHYGVLTIPGGAAVQDVFHQQYLQNPHWWISTVNGASKKCFLFKVVVISSRYMGRVSIMFLILLSLSKHGCLS